jgi:hypothetical protein
LIRETFIGSSPLAHVRYLHGMGNGYATLAQKPGWQQRSYPLEELYEILPAYGGMNDVYISQNRFYGSRSNDKIAELSAMYTDVDYYKCRELAEMHAAGVLDLALESLVRERIPYPSLAMATGRGLALVWRHEPVPGYARTKWERCQERIFEALKGLGADPMAKSASQVLRLAGTYNSKSGALVESIFENLDDVWDFGELADEILPLTSEELEARRAQRRALRATRDARRRPERQSADTRGFNLDTLAEARMHDLRYLLEIRGWDNLPPGQRDSWMFVAGVMLSYLVEARALEREIIALGRDYADWSEGETKSRMHTVIDKAQTAAAGEKVLWKGQQRHPRYWLKNQSIIDRLEITPEEERHLKTIISEDTRRERDRERKERARRSQGAQPRDEYIADARETRQHTRREAQTLRGEGRSLREIGRVLGISHTQVGRLLEGGRESR